MAGTDYDCIEIVRGLQSRKVDLEKLSSLRLRPRNIPRSASDKWNDNRQFIPTAPPNPQKGLTNRIDLVIVLKVWKAEEFRF